MSEHSFDSNNETQEVNVTLNTSMANQNQLLNASANKAGLLGIPEADVMSHQSKSIYQAPSTNDFRSQTQFMLGNFHDQWGHEAAQNNRLRDYQRNDGEDSNDEEIQKDPGAGFTNVLNRYNTAEDAQGCTKIQTLKEYISGIQTEQKNPKTNFFDLSREYYTGKYKGNNKKQIKVRSFLITEKHENFIKDLSMEIVQTHQGCMPIIKTYEFNAYNDKKFIKALKFYNYKGDCKLKDQIIVDEGIMSPKFRTFDTSLLHFGNCVIFYKREENWHKLQKYDVVTDKLEEIPGYNIEEPIGEEIRYHVMFSAEFGSKKNTASSLQKMKTAKKSFNPDRALHEFLEKHYVWVQSYQITEDLAYINKPLKGFKLISQLGQSVKGNRKHLPELHPGGGFQSDSQYSQICDPKLIITKDKQEIRQIYLENKEEYEFQVHLRDVNGVQREYEVHKFPIQYVTHKIDAKGIVTFIAFDSFNQHHFKLDPKTDIYGRHDIFYGNNEFHLQDMESILGNAPKLKGCQETNEDYNKLQDEYEELLHSQETESSIGTGDRFMPFLKHLNAQFTIQMEKIHLKVGDELYEDFDQYFYMTNDNQYMLIYPNYQPEKKKKVIFELAQRFQYNRNPDEDYDYQDDYEERMRDYYKSQYKKVSHVCINDYRSKNHMKRAKHIQDIVKYERPFNHQDKIILSTDQQSNLIYIYQSFVPQAKVTVGEIENVIEIYNYENNIVNTANSTTLPRQIKEIKNQEAKTFTNHLSKTFYINAKYRHIASSHQYIKTTQKTKSRIDLSSLPEDKANQIRHYIQQDPKARQQYKDLDLVMPPTFQEHFIWVEKAAGGGYMSIRVKQETCNSQFYLELYTKNKKYFTFIFKYFGSDKDPQQAYFAVRKTIKEVEDMKEDNNVALIQEYDVQKVTVFLNNKFDGKTDDAILSAYTKEMTFNQFLSEMKGPQATHHLNFTFEQCLDNRTDLDCLPIIYQEKSSLSSHHLIVFDIFKQRVVRHSNLRGNLNVRKLLRVDQDGFGYYTLTRTSDIASQKFPMFLNHGCGGNQSSQIMKYQVGTQFFLNHLYEEQRGIDGINPASCTFELSEYAIRLSCCHQNRIQLIGKKQMLVSEANQELRRETFDNIVILPWLDKKTVFKGSQFVLQEEEDLSVIRLLDQEINTLFQHSSETIQYGHQKFLTSQDTHDEYILVISSQLKQRIWMDYFFENSESYYIHQKVIKKLLSMQLAKFEYFVLNDDFEALMREEFYQTQEVLQGKSINDLCLGFPREVAHGLKQKKEQYSSIKGSLIEEVCNADDAIMDSYEAMDICEKNLLIQVDFNFCSSLRIAAELNANQSVKMLLAKIFEINDVAYQGIFMLELARMLQLPRIERLYEFLNRDYEERKENEQASKAAQVNENKSISSRFLNLEDFNNHPHLPTFLSEKQNYHVKYRFDDFHNAQEEIVQEVASKNDFETYTRKPLKDIFKNLVPKKYRGPELMCEDDSAQTIEVEHSSINFDKVIIGEKIRNIQEFNYRHVQFNDNHLASIFFVEDDEHMDFYNLEAVRKVIDFQFVRTQNFLQYMMLAYIFGFLVPYTMSLSCTTVFFLNILYNICLFTQVFFIIFEGLQIKEQRLDYFKDFWNILDCTQFINFVMLYSIKMKSQFQTDSMFEIVLQSLLLIQTFYKMIYYLRIYESYSFLITISTLVMHELYGYLVLALLIMLAISKQYVVMHFGINDTTGAFSKLGASGENQFIKLMIQTYKTNKGNVNVPALDNDFITANGEDSFYSNIMYFMNLFVWVAQQGIFVMLGVLYFNTVFQSYEKYYPSMQTRMYKIKAKFNSECYDIVDMFVEQRNFKVISFAIAKNLKFQSTDKWEGIHKNIHMSITEQQENMQLQRKQAKEVAKTRYGKMIEVSKSSNSIDKRLGELADLLNPRGNCGCQRY